MDSEASSQSSDSGLDCSGFSQISRKPKQIKNQCKAWNFQYTLSTDLLGEEGVTTHEKTSLLTEHLRTRLGHRKPLRYCILRFQIRAVAFDRCKPFDFNSYHRIRPIPEQHSLRDDRMVPGRFMGASPRRLGRPPRFSAVHEPCREYCRALVQAFRVWRARIKQRRPPSGERKSKGIPQTRSLPHPSV